MLLCCACGGAAASSTGGSPATPAPAAAPPVAIAPEASSERRTLPLRFFAAEGCPGVEGYLSDVDSRASTLELEVVNDAPEAAAASGDDERVEVRVEPAPDARGWLGHVLIVGPRALDREVRGDRCEDVVAALALITVLRLEGSDAGERGAASGAASDAARGSSTAAGAGTASGAASASTPPAAASGASTAPGAPGSEPRSPAASPASPAASVQPTAPGAASSGAASSGAASASPALAPDGSARSEPNASQSTAESAAAAARGDREATSAPAPAASAPDESSATDDERRVARSSRTSEPEPPESIAREPLESEAAPPSDTRGAVAETEPEAAESLWSWPATSFGIAALGGYATVPSHAVRAALEGELRLGEGSSAWLSSLSFGYAHGDHSRAPSDLGLTLLTLELALCPPSFIAEPSLWISACASVRAGTVRLAYSATESDIAARDTWRPWLAVGPSLRAGVPLSERWALRGVAQLALQLVRDTYRVGVGPAQDPEAESVPLYRPEALSFELGVGIGYSF